MAIVGCKDGADAARHLCRRPDEVTPPARAGAGESNSGAWSGLRYLCQWWSVSFIRDSLGEVVMRVINFEMVAGSDCEAVGKGHDVDASGMFGGGVFDASDAA